MSASPPQPAPEPAFASTVFMVRPGAFGANPETAASNVFQARAGDTAADDATLLERAQGEWDALHEALVAAGVEVVAEQDRDFDGVPPGPDACFPNNWFTTHADGRLVLYPMESPTRRREARSAFIARIATAVGATSTLDLRAAEADGRFLEGTGSLIPDRERRIVFAALASRTDAGLLADWCDALHYRAVSFRTELRGAPIYHTNVMLALGPDVALVGLDAVPDGSERATLASELEATGRELMPLSESDLLAFCGNVLFLRTRAGDGVWAMSARAAEAFGPQRLARLERTGAIVAPDVSTIEDVGGGGVRCMLAELIERAP
ncbi:hypothetical protein Pla163_25240 [Planctomycetes bacterium Pla163]|uniref:Amidinotransferase n=1 Tax=Rohdeia mirabilis TaxID=2528008 RepID=A0A518D1T1_9BACT|nr:hypothetical protein Pla163_25240 [Planctomycetes bacterium Pla163]